MDFSNDYLLAIFLIFIIYVIGKMIDNDKIDSKTNVSDDIYHKNNIGDIENNTSDFELRESIANKLVDDYERFKNQSMYNNFNNLTNGNIVDIFYSEISQNLKNRNDAEKFVFYCLAKMYAAYSFDEYTRLLIDNCGISIGKFLLYANDHTKNTANILINTLLLECGSRSNKLLGVIALRMITSEVMLKYDIGNSRYIYDMVNNPDNMMKYL